ncbi:unnamed protein product [Blepharisma stoltei]|uniref:Uncharacterized protein n=1 Tax=Blepharisma stoltei TaxID=1481888 RepID=A0AAU9JV38_9CILI|nr:unnamed protein product [Blepharisma stoltei]
MEEEKRAKNSGQEENRYQKLIALIGDFGEEKVPIHIEKLKSELISADQQFYEFLTELLAKCISSIPGKQHIYATVLAKVFEQNSALVKIVIDKLLGIYKDILQEGNLLRIKLVLRFLGEASALHLISSSYFNSLLNRLISLWREYSQTTWDFFPNILASTFLHEGQQVDQEIFASFRELLKLPRNHAWKKYCKIHQYQSEEGRLEQLEKAVEHFSLQGFPQPRSLSLSTPLNEGLTLDEPAATQWSEKWKYQSPLCFDLLNTGLDSIENTLTYEKASEIIDAFKAKTRLAAEKLLVINQPKLVVNVLIDELLTLPKSPSKPIIYSSILLNLQTSSAASNIFEPLIEESIETLISLLDTIDFSALEKFQDFIAHYISNQNFVWNWQSFLSRVPLTESQIAFVRGVIYKLVRLSDVDFVKAELPEPFHIYLPADPEAHLRFAEIEESVDNTDCQLIIDRINSRATNQAMKALLASKEICSSGDFLLQIFCECLFFQGAKSMLHITTYLERYFEIMSSISGIIILESLANVWKTSPQRISLLAQKLVQIKLVDYKELTQFCVGRIVKGDQYKDYNSLEWNLLNFIVDETSQSSKFEIVDIVLRGVDLLNRNAEKRAIEFLRREIKDLDELQFNAIENLVRERLPTDISSLKIIV